MSKLKKVLMCAPFILAASAYANPFQSNFIIKSDVMQEADATVTEAEAESEKVEIKEVMTPPNFVANSIINIKNAVGTALANSLKVRKAPWGETIACVNSGEEIEILNSEDDWYHISHNGTEGYVHASWVDVKGFDYKIPTKGFLIDDAAFYDETGKLIGRFEDEMQVQILADFGNYWRISVGANDYYYVRKSSMDSDFIFDSDDDEEEDSNKDNDSAQDPAHAEFEQFVDNLDAVLSDDPEEQDNGSSEDDADDDKDDNDSDKEDNTSVEASVDTNDDNTAKVEKDEKAAELAEEARKAEEEAKLRAEEEANKRAEEEAKWQAEKEALEKALEEAKKAREEAEAAEKLAIEKARAAEAEKQALEETLKKAEELKAKEEAEKKAKEAALKKAEEEKKAQEAAKKKAEADKKAQEAAKKKAEAEKKAQEAAKKKAEADKRAQEAASKNVTRTLQGKKVTLPAGDKVYFLDVADVPKGWKVEKGADCIIIESEGKFGMIDTGMAQPGKMDTTARIKKYLKELGIKKLDFLLFSHTHGDHDGGFKKAIVDNGIKIKTLYLKNDGGKYKNDVKLGKKAGASIYTVEKHKSTKFTLGNMKFELFNTKKTNTSDKNINTIVAVATVNGKKICFGGDMQSSTSGSALADSVTAKIGKVDVYKAAHHGYTSPTKTTRNNSEKVFKNLSPKYVVVTNTARRLKKSHMYDTFMSRAKKHANKKNIYFTGDGTVVMNINSKGEITFKKLAANK